jgi:hypothetical protein
MPWNEGIPALPLTLPARVSPKSRTGWGKMSNILFVRWDTFGLKAPRGWALSFRQATFFLRKAREYEKQAEQAQNAVIRENLENLAKDYRRLAEDAMKPYRSEIE